MAKKICFVSIDVEKDLGRESFLGVESIDKILSIFKKYDVPATMFVTGEVLQKYPKKLRQLADIYEIACHGFTHRFWDTLNGGERQKELDDFNNLYRRVFQRNPSGFRAPSHVIDAEALSLLEKKGFLYDSSVLPHYPPLKKYRGYKGKAPLTPYYPKERKILEIPVSGHFCGIPLAGAWIRKLPLLVYKILFLIHSPKFITLSLHSWEDSKKFEEIIRLLKSKNYKFFNGEQIYKNYR